MEEKVMIQIEPDENADEIKITKRPSGAYLVSVPSGMDLEKDEKAQEIFAEQFNLAYRENDLEKENIFDANSRLHRVELRRLNEAITKGEKRHNMRIPIENLH